jgi:hypothetical protein
MLFSKDIDDYLQAFWEDVVHFSAAWRACRRHYDAHGTYGPSLDTEHFRLEKLGERLRTMPETFSREMGFDVEF